VNVYSQENYPVYGQFVEVDEMPKYDSLKLKSLIVYPDIAKRSLVEGLVKVAVLVDSEGSIVKKGVVYSDSRILDNSLLEAIKQYGMFKPAIKDNKKISSWIEIPYYFKLTSKDSVKVVATVISNCNFNFRKGNYDNDTLQETDYPEPDEFVACEKTPNIDMKKLQSLVEFPKKYGNICIEGRVIVKILVAKNGDIVKKIIEKTDSELLNEAAFDAFDKYGKVEPAIQNGKPIHCWVSVPISFRLR
jgi:TonB family protein